MSFKFTHNHDKKYFKRPRRCQLKFETVDRYLDFVECLAARDDQWLFITQK